MRNEVKVPHVRKVDKRILPFIIAIAIFMQMLDSTILNTALPAMAKSLGETTLNMQSAIISYVLTMALFIPVSGYLADKFGTKKIFVLALLLFSLGSLLSALSTKLNYLVIARIVQGLGGALMTPVARLTILRTYEKNEIVSVMNYAVIPALIGPIAGPLIGGYLVEYVSWHWIFLINIPFGILGFLLALKYMPNFTTTHPKIDLLGFVIFGSASLILSIALEAMGHPKLISYVIAALVVGFVLFYLYFKYAKNKDDALFPLDLFSIRTFRVGIIGNLACRIGISSIPLLLPLLVQEGYGKSSSLAGWILAPMALAGMVSKPLILPIINKIGYRRVLVGNTVIIGLLIMSMAIPGEQVNVLWFIPCTFILGGFNSIQFTSMNTISIADLRDRQTSSGNSLLAVNQQLSIGFGIAIGLSVLRFFQTNTVFFINNTHATFRYTFVVMGFLTILSSLVFTRLHHKDGDNLTTKDK